MDKNSYFQIVGKIILNESQQDALWHCYYPLIHRQGFILYSFLQYHKNFRLESLMTLLKFSMNEFKQAKALLEQCGLLDSYVNDQENRYLLYVKPCLSMESFIKHDLLSRYYIDKQGSKAFDLLVEYVNNQQIKIVDGYRYDTATLNEFMKNWNYRNEDHYKTRKKVDKKYEFPINELLSDLSYLVFPDEQRVPEILDLICEMADLYQVDKKTMKQYVIHSVGKEGKPFDQEKFKSLCRHTIVLPKTSKKHQYDEYPSVFLKQMFPNSKINDSELKLLQRLSIKYDLTNEVINVLIEYTLKQCNNTLPNAYVEKIATSLSRNNITTYEKALDFLTSTPKENKVNNQPKVLKPKNDDEVIVERKKASQEEIIALMRKLRGETS